MEEKDKIIEISDNQEEMKVENTVETHKEEEDGYDIWVKKHIGEKDLTDAFNYASKVLKSIGKWKLKYFAYTIKYIGYGIGSILGLILGGFLLHALFSGFSHIFDMMTDDTDSYSYAFLDSDLWATVIISVLISVSSFGILGKATKVLLYCLFLIAIVEYWDYIFLTTHDTNSILGGSCFWLFFVIIPILLIVKFSTDSDKTEEKTDEEKRYSPESD